jgi:hypothetical protein
MQLELQLDKLEAAMLLLSKVHILPVSETVSASIPQVLSVCGLDDMPL